MIRPRKWAAPAAAFLFFAAASVAMTWPLAAGLSRQVADPGDPYLNAYILRWDYRQFFRDPLHLFDANIFHPARLALAFSENLFGASVFGFPLAAAGASPITVHNVVFLLGMALSAFGAWALAREMTGDAVAAPVAGAFYAFVPFRFAHLSHVQMQWGPFLPLFLLFLWRYFRSGSGRDLALYSLFFAWNAIACVHYGVFGAIALAVTLALEAIERPKEFGARAGRFAVASGAAAAAIFPFALPYIRASRLYHFQRGLAEVVFYSATWKAFLSAGVRSRVYGNLTARFAAPEAELFFGLVVPVLAVVGFVWSPRRVEAVPPEARRGDARIALLDAAILILAAARAAFAVSGGFRLGFFRVHEPYRLSMALCVAVIARLIWAFPRSARHPHLPGWLRARKRAPATIWAVSMIVVGVVVALGANFFPYREMYELFRPVLASIRAPGRGIVLAHLGAGVLAAQGVSALRARRASSGLLVSAVAVGLLLAELRAAPLLLADAIPAVPAAVRWTDTQVFAGGVLELPMKVSDDCSYVLWAAGHDFPIVNGYSGFFPPEHQRLVRAFGGSLSASEAAALLSENDVAVVLFHRGRAVASEQKGISGLLLRLCATGVLRPVQRMGTGSDDTVICAVVRTGASFPSSDSESAAALDALAHPLSSPGRPQGWFYAPGNGATFRGTTIRGSGWAASDDGIARIEVWLDGKNVGSAAYGRYHPDVPMAKPNVACGAFCGYDYRIEHVSAGRHVLGYRYVGRNGGVATPANVEIWVRP